MEGVDYLVAGARQLSTSSSWEPAKQWRKAVNVIRTCHRLARLSILSTGILPRSASYVNIKIHHESDADDDGSGNDRGTEFTVAADDEAFKGLVKEKRDDCFRRLGGGTGIAAALASGAERG